MIFISFKNQNKDLHFWTVVRHRFLLFFLRRLKPGNNFALNHNCWEVSDKQIKLLEKASYKVPNIYKTKNNLGYFESINTYGLLLIWMANIEVRAFSMAWWSKAMCRCGERISFEDSGTCEQMRGYENCVFGFESSCKEFLEEQNTSVVSYWDIN